MRIARIVPKKDVYRQALAVGAAMMGIPARYHFFASGGSLNDLGLLGVLLSYKRVRRARDGIRSRTDLTSGTYQLTNLFKFPIYTYICTSIKIK